MKCSRTPVSPGVGHQKSVRTSLTLLPTTGRMVKTAQSGCGHDLGVKRRMAFDSSFGRSIFVQADVSSVLMIVVNVVAPKPAKMILVQRDGMVEQFATHAARPAL
jgi:hypothetical protein